MQSLKGKDKDKSERGQVPARVFMIFARESPTAVIFRRGPSRWVQLIHWNTKTDVLQPGQWFHGRIYERRSDLSPDGSLLVYFARGPGSKIPRTSDTEYTHAWTAVSRPPFLTALAVWPKGDCYHGGGLFKNDGVLLLNHKPEVAEPHKEHQPQGLLVIPNENATGEDDPIFSQRLERDGWELKIPWRVEYLGYLGYHTVQTEVRERVNADRTYVLRLTRSIEGFHDVEKFTIRGMKQSVETQVDRVGWMDWDQQGRLVFTRDGKIFAGALKNDGQLTEEELVDLNPSSPQPLPAPEWATKW